MDSGLNKKNTDSPTTRFSRTATRGGCPPESADVPAPLRGANAARTIAWTGTAEGGGAGLWFGSQTRSVPVSLPQAAGQAARWNYMARLRIPPNVIGEFVSEILIMLPEHVLGKEIGVGHKFYDYYPLLPDE